MDGDGSLDVLSAALGDDRVAWHRNVSGAGTAWTFVPVSTTVLGPAQVAGADIDGDGDRDVVSAAYDGAAIAWHENTAGDGTAWTAHPVAAGVAGASGVSVADVDGDGDGDVLAAAAYRRRREALQAGQMARLARLLPLPQLVTSFRFTPALGPGDLQALAAELRLGIEALA